MVIGVRTPLRVAVYDGSMGMEPSRHPAECGTERTRTSPHARRRARRRDASKLAVALLFLLVMGCVWAQPPLGHLEFERGDAPVGGSEYRLGINAFTGTQLAYFLSSIETFLMLARDLPDGERVTLRQEGQRGYIALTAYDTHDTPFFVLTLAAEEPTGIKAETGLKALWVYLAEQIEMPTASSAEPFALP